MVWFSSLSQCIVVSELAKHCFERWVKHTNIDMEPVLNVKRFKHKSCNYSKPSVIHKHITCSISICCKCYHFKAITWNSWGDDHKSIYIWSHARKIQNWSSRVPNLTEYQKLSYVLDCYAIHFLNDLFHWKKQKFLYAIRIWRQNAKV